MKKSGRKLLAFLILAFKLFSLYILMLFKAPELLNILGGHFLWAMIFNVGIFITGNVAYAFQRSKFFVPDLKVQGK